MELSLDSSVEWKKFYMYIFSILTDVWTSVILQELNLLRLPKLDDGTLLIVYSTFLLLAVKVALMENPSGTNPWWIIPSLVEKSHNFDFFLMLSLPATAFTIWKLLYYCLSLSHYPSYTTILLQKLVLDSFFSKKESLIMFKEREFDYVQSPSNLLKCNSGGSVYYLLFISTVLLR